MIEQAGAWYENAAPHLFAAAAFLLFLTSLAAPVGRMIAPWEPRVAEVLIRFGNDTKGAREAIRLPPGTPSVSAQSLPKVLGDAAASLEAANAAHDDERKRDTDP